MHCLVTAGPTIEPVDEVRRLINQSTGRLGCKLADDLNRAGHRVTLLLSKAALHVPRSKRIRVIRFSTIQDLKEHLENASALKIKAVFHAAAVSDFHVTKSLKGKVSSTKGFTIHLKPSPKLIKTLRKSYPDSFIVGWKYEVSGDRESTVELAKQQINKCNTDLCVVNGPGYGDGYGVVNSEVTHCASDHSLFRLLNHHVTSLQ